MVNVCDFAGLSPSFAPKFCMAKVRHDFRTTHCQEGPADPQPALGWGLAWDLIDFVQTVLYWRQRWQSPCRLIAQIPTCQDVSAWHRAWQEHGSAASLAPSYILDV